MRLGPSDNYGMTSRVAAEHDLGNRIPKGGYPEPATPTVWSEPIPKPPRPWTWDGEVIGGE